MAVDEECIYSAEIMKTIADSDYMRDVGLVAGMDGERIRVHRVVMAAASKYFKSLFAASFEDWRRDDIIFSQIDGPTLKMIIDFCYIGRTALTETNVYDVLAAAKSMELPKLEQKCREFCGINMSDCNLVTTLLNADKYDLKELRQKSIRAICDDFENIPINELQKLDGNIFCEILNNDAVAASETIIFNRLKKWLSNHEHLRLKFAGKLLNAIRLEHIPLKVLRDNIEPLFEKNGCMKLVLDEYRERLFDNRVRSLCRISELNIFFGYYNTTCTCMPTTINLQKYNFESNTWTEFRTIGALCSRMSFVNGDLVLFQGNPCIKIEAYDLISLRKRKMPFMTEKRSEFKTIVVGKHLYVFGGSGRNGEECCRCERFNTDRRVWESLSPSLFIRYAQSTIVELNGVVYFHQSKKNNLLRYDTIKDRWSETSELSADAETDEHNYISSIFKSKGFLYAIASGNLHKYDTGMNNWTKLTSTGEYADILVQWTIEYSETTYAFTSSGFGCVIPEDECIFHPLCTGPNYNYWYNGMNPPFLAYSE